jgi:hypothetical protein
MKNALSGFSKSTALTLEVLDVSIAGRALRNMRWAHDMLFVLDLNRNETITNHLWPWFIRIQRFKDVSARTEKRILTDKLQPVIKVMPFEQPIPYVEDKVPIPWIDFFDKLKLMASRSGEDHDPVSYLATGLLLTARTLATLP